MSTELAASESGTSRSAVPRWRNSTWGRFVRGMLRQTLAQPIAAGRLRDVGWPFGLRAVVAAGYGMFALAGFLVIMSAAVRSNNTLIISGTLGVGMPDVTVWPMVVLLSFGTASLITAVLHGPAWLKIIGLLFVLAIMGTWSLRSTGLHQSTGWFIAGVVIMVAMLVLVILRWRRSFAWWEFGAAWTLIGASMTVGVVESRSGKSFGFDFNVQLLQQTAGLLGFLALPAAMVAGAAVAEIVVGATVSAVRQAQRLAHRRWPYVILAAVCLLRGIQAVRQYLNRDPVSQGMLAYIPAVAIVIGFAVIGVVVLRVSRKHDAEPTVSELGDHLVSVGFAVAAALIVVQIPVQVGLSVLQVLAGLNPGGAASRATANISFVNNAVDPLRVLIGVALVVLAVRAARRGRTDRGLILGCVGVMLLALARNLFVKDASALPIDADVLNLVSTVVVVVAIVATALRRRLTRQRALAFAGILILSALFSTRDFISDPLGFLLGFSGAALLLFGLTWDLLTGSGWGNGDSRRFPRPTRVLLVLTNSVLTMTVLAYAALIRDGSTTIYLDPYAAFGDLIFGTALLAAAVVAVFDVASRNAAVS